MQLFDRIRLTTIVLTFSLVVGLGWASAASVFAQADAEPGPLPVEFLDEDEEDYQACATLIGEGALCGWPQVELPEDDPSDPWPNDGDVPCPASLDAALPCLSEGDEQGGGQGKPEFPGQPAEDKCPVQVGDGVICTGPTPIDLPPQSNVPWDHPGEGEPGDEDRPGQDEPVNPDPVDDDPVSDEPTDEQPGVNEPDVSDPDVNVPGDGAEIEPVVDETEDAVTDKGPVLGDFCGDIETDGATECDPEHPAAGQNSPMIFIFVPMVNGQP